MDYLFLRGEQRYLVDGVSAPAGRALYIMAERATACI
jgi:hypothetical protein